MIGSKTAKTAMETKTARLTVLLDPAKKEAFEELCARLDITPSQVVRQLIRDYLRHHGVTYVPSGAGKKSHPARLSQHLSDHTEGRSDSREGS
jgi:ribbon-helix-helix protein